ncbi:MAG: DUF4153 domain-containing protein [Candidatus Omnitrophica bacterium]|nr:DUF4153 domain-containing protein [Candidatus Omnitrophota bacterium]
MTRADGAALLEERISEWRAHLDRRQAIRSVDVEELEDHLRAQVETLREAGLDEDEAFLVGVKRMGELDSISREFALEYSERLWKQLVVSSGKGETSTGVGRDALVAVGLAIAAAAALKAPALFGLEIAGRDADLSFYRLNLCLLVFPFLAIFFAWKRGLPQWGWGWLAIPFVAAGLLVNLMPFVSEGHTEALAALHLPIALWLTVGFAYVGGQWRSGDQRMNYIRFSGEWFIYYSLIALGGGVLTAFTLFVFRAIGLNIEPIAENWIIPCGAAGAVLIGAWLVESKQSVIENMAPVLTLLFTPLFALLLLVFLGTMLWTGNPIEVEREVLIGFDLLLALVLGLLLYAISARDPLQPPGWFDVLQVVLVVSALLVDAFALWAILARINEYGFTPNRTAALGENLILLVNLGWSAVLYTKFLMRRSRFVTLERWQTGYVPVYFVWAWVVVGLFPVLFGFR